VPSLLAYLMAQTPLADKPAKRSAKTATKRR
jgi:hypothetical protein